MQPLYLYFYLFIYFSLYILNVIRAPGFSTRAAAAPGVECIAFGLQTPLFAVWILQKQSPRSVRTQWRYRRGVPHSPRLPCSEELGRGGLNHNRPPLYRLHPTRCLRSGTTACPRNMPELWSMESSLDQGLLHPAAPLGTFLLHNQLQRQSPGGSHGDQAQTLISLSINNADKRHTPPSDASDPCSQGSY